MKISKRKIIIGFLITLFIMYFSFGFLKTCVHYFYFKYPKFYYQVISSDELGIPVIMYHTITEKEFEEDLKYLKKNHYRTMTANEFYHYIKKGDKPSDRCILITVDDGRKSLYKVIYPLLKKYKMKATAFILPYHHDHPELECRYIPEELKTDEEKYECSFDGHMFVNWQEIIEMHQTGIIDFQSHGINQYRIPVSNEIVDFYHPEFRTGFALDRIPVFTAKELEYEHALEFGRPIYRNASRLDGFEGYYEDKNLYEECTQYVHENGGVEFFLHDNWRKKLYQRVESYKSKNKINERCESYKEMSKKLDDILLTSKQEIEKKLLDHQVKYIATPWGESSPLASTNSRNAGYNGLFITDEYGTCTCQYGDNPYSLHRIDHDNKMVFSLPGNGRISFIKRYLDKWIYFLLHPNKL